MEAQDAATMSPGFSGLVTAQATDSSPLTWAANLARKPFWRAAMTNIAIGESQGAIQPEQQPDASAEEVNKAYPNPDPQGPPLFNEPIPMNWAKTIYDVKTQQYQAETDIARFEANHSWPVNMISEIPGMLTDVTGDALAFIPGVGEEALAARLGGSLLARAGARVATGAAAGALQQAPATTARYIGDDDFKFRDALKQELFGAAGGALLNLGIGGPIDVVRYFRGTLPKSEASKAAIRTEAPGIAAATADTNYAAAQSAVAQVVSGRPVDVADLFAAPKTEAAVGQMLNNRFYQHIEPADLGLDRTEVARSIDPKFMRRFEAAQQQKTDLAAQLAKMNEARAGGETAAGNMIGDQIAETQRQLAGQLSKAKRAAAEGRLAELQGQLQKVPNDQDFARVQQAYQDADIGLRNMAPQAADVFGRADETMARAIVAEYGARYEDMLRQQKEWMPRMSEWGGEGMTRDLWQMAAREQGWRKTGVAPGISHEDLVQAIGEVDKAARTPSPAPEPTPKPPEGWMNPPTSEKPTGGATGAETPGAVAAPGKEDTYAQAAQIALKEGSVSSSRIQQEFGIGYPEASKLRDRLLKEGVIDEQGKTLGPPIAPAEKPPMSFAEAYPEYEGLPISAEDREMLMSAHGDVEKAGKMEAALKEAGQCAAAIIGG